MMTGTRTNKLTRSLRAPRSVERVPASIVGLTGAELPKLATGEQSITRTQMRTQDANTRRWARGYGVLRLRSAAALYAQYDSAESLAWQDLMPGVFKS